MISRTLAALLAVAAVVSAGPAAAEDFNLARHLLEHGDIAPEDVDYWTRSARQYDDWVAWRKIVERETAKAETQRREAAWREAELVRLEKELSDFQKKQAALDPKATMSSGPLEEYLEELERAKSGLDPKATMSSGPLEEYLERYEREKAAGLDPKATNSSGPLQEYLEKYERAKAALRAGAQGVGGELKGVQAVERWVQVVVDSTGEVIENDPVDVAHARLEDLARRQGELEARLKGTTDPGELSAIADELIALEREVDQALSQIAGHVFRLRSPLRNVCFPPPVKDKPVAVFDCQYWAQGVPIAINLGGDRIIIDRIRLDIDIREDRDEARVGYFWRYVGQPSPSEPQSNPGGELRHGPGGVLFLVIPWTDEDGDEQETLYSLTLASDRASGFFPPISDEGAHHLTFRRDPENYIPWQDYEAAAKGKPPERRTPYTPAEDLAPLTPTSVPAPQSAPYTPAEDLAPLTPAPAPAEGEDDYLAPLTPSPPSEGEDDYLAPLTPP